MNKILKQCDKCDGTGTIAKTNKANYGIFGFGFANIADWLSSSKWQEKCDKCDGNGVYYVITREIKTLDN